MATLQHPPPPRLLPVLRFEDAYMAFLSNLSTATRPAGPQGKRSSSRLQRALADSLRECFSDPTIVGLVKQATSLRLREGAARR